MSLQAQVVLESDSGLPKDRTINTFAFSGGPDAASAQTDALMQALVNFYNVAPAGSADNVATWLSPRLAGAADAHRIKLYHVPVGSYGGEPHGSPIDERTFTLAAPGSTEPLPSEVAYAVTLEAINRELQPVEGPDDADADAAPERPRQRYTGRIYLGPLNTLCLSGGGEERPRPALGTTARLAIDALQTEVVATLPVLTNLAVWSRADRSFRTITHVSTDDAWDTQRRRGQAPSARVRHLI